ncbi:16S rRNA (guanine(527)-N(7))-methyltransferase RsmG [Rubrobacter aplysinae]|uniref:16S rRNA (guanine(527)-N(7))-methyltransferase RsmG n=1 Tax=Rubrobacter aplysinae TaxID=909625 RepID=UPI00069FBB37|nr:16S rRNA (guanine(527)-N(7))-methyltransferase RsmG [Rubrobacter aplysinae]
MKQELGERAVGVFEEQLAQWGVTLGQSEIEALTRYSQELATYEKANVVGTGELERIWLDHVLDSLSCLLYRPLTTLSSLIDVGSGGGMPGIPLHLALDLHRTCLLESTGKKAEFLRHVSESLSLEGVEVANVRAEEFGLRPGRRDSYEAATVRAVDSLSVISEYCLPFLEPGGAMVAMKGPLGAEERTAGERAAQVLAGELEAVIRVPFSADREHKERHLMIVRKTGPTPESYPRPTGTPHKRPLYSAG